MVNVLHGENVGASARAMKTMGFTDLALVSPSDARVLRRRRVIQRSSGANDVLDRATVHATLVGALAGCDVVCGTGMPHDMSRARTARGYVEPRVYFEKLAREVGEDEVVKLAVVLGSEKTGLLDEDADMCDVMLGVPTDPRFGSLNLSGAVQVLAYDLRMALGGKDSYADDS